MLEPARLAAQLNRLAPHATGLRVGFSGGRDSTALLHCLARQRRQLSAELSAIHVDHGLHAESANWAQHCQRFCSDLGIPLVVSAVQVDQNSHDGLEAAARRARYAAYTEALEPGNCLILAHHADDQAETFLLRALRGGGLNTLSAIPPHRPLAKSTIARPLLGVRAEDIDEYVHSNHLPWIDDPANSESSFDRVYIRQSVIPQLKRRWPDAAKRLNSSAASINRDRQLLNHYLDADLRYVRAPRGYPSVCRLAELNEQRRLAIVRRWLECSGVRPPPREHLISGLHSLIYAAADANPVLTWADAVVRRFRDHLYLCLDPRSNEHHNVLSGDARPSPHPGQSMQAGQSGALSNRWQWQPQEPLELPGGTLEARLSPARGLDPRYLRSNLEVRWPPNSAAHLPAQLADEDSKRDTRRRKRLYQSLAVPPWERSSKPLIYIDGKPVAVAGFGCDNRYSSRPGVRILWFPDKGAANK
ncbi:tRNA(Ile)-lysidine synthetase [Halorhodospira halochloris]|uniref:tRNA(Ile)-lysidine synthase n=1 Tax=Halorhodospira halochloris TaxID=1052 RepID=A0A0X8X9D1_HALHR|nr:tRNA lysidine(34) synthetase TilS [Halorhodospira halochloris]MBK1651195.1 tRNA lysidine(34) synthetase TilS [Halorhodospira halochloris]BAU57467.1 tRNA(Ile)-lysidine synthetase [Halorhodospira halochloris]